MKNKIFIIIAVVILAGAGWLVFKNVSKAKNASKTVIQEIKPIYGNIRNLITATGTVEPQNRLEMKPSISGRIEEILVKEGDNVRKGQTLAMMSSEDRAALLDAAALQDEKTVKYWSEVYKQVPLTAPIDGEVIVRAVEPGQSVTTATVILVLSDRLIINAQVDETDIGKVKIGQAVVITLDAYPAIEIKGIVDHIAYESNLVNNVTIYEVDILPEQVPEFFRSGMSANVAIVEKAKDNVLLIPNDALIKEKNESFVRLPGTAGSTPELRKVSLGMSDDVHTEVVSGLDPNQAILAESKTFKLSEDKAGKNPFMPTRRR
jgi:macrolide-specific efflux system membrane fusion protein